ncbi:transcription factor bHLH121-like isoform X2 [Helianthus annuus]|uniref:transcription factor bHLH121-like isoform X2 n=1 Tax=Helianthus annuus TaxID=4232 RepID=UPI001653252F|nr:transcription factor bHLH121-like isoform X2 [Helianthus annuus]
MTQFPLNLHLLLRHMLIAIKTPNFLFKTLTLTLTLISILLLVNMDQWKPKLELHQRQDNQHHYIPNDRREMTEVEVKDTNEARKVQKADREKLRRDRLNEQFIELGNVLGQYADPDRPKNDKASIIIDTIQVLKDLTAEVKRLKAECRALSEESCEEKNELREEKSSLKSDIENLNAQYQQRVRVMPPWGAINPSSVVMPQAFPVALPIHTGPIPLHPFSFFTNHNPPGAVPTSAPAFMPYPNQTIPVYANVAPTSYSRFRGHDNEKRDDSSDLVTELELKTPGSRSGQEPSGGDKKGKQLEGGCSSSRQTSSSNSVVDNNGGV